MAATPDPSAPEPERSDAGVTREVLRRAESLADRLAVVGPRMAARESAAAAAVLDDIRSVVQQLADLGADAEGRERRPVPVLGAHALGDQVRVLAQDVAGAQQPTQIAAALVLLRELAGRI